MLHKSHFLKKLSCSKPYWDQARLFILVNEQVACAPAPVVLVPTEEFIFAPRQRLRQVQAEGEEQGKAGHSKSLRYQKRKFTKERSIVD